MGKHHRRSLSFADLDAAQASGILTDVLRENNVYLGGSSMGKGLKHAARHYLTNLHGRDGTYSAANKPDFFNLPGAIDLCPEAELAPVEDSFYVVDLGVVVSQVYQWRRYFPRVEPFYAVKCNPDPVIVKTLATLGCNFDCASRNEIRLVLEASRDLPRKPEIIYANPCKARAHLLEAVCKGVRMVTFDNTAEVAKCAAISKNIQLILRIITDDRGAQCRLSSKFGAPRQKWRPLLAAAVRHGLKVVGVSFHVGSGCRDASRYEAALKDAREIFDMAKTEFNMEMTILDIGGGFPGETHSMWNPAVELDEEEKTVKEGKVAPPKDPPTGHEEEDDDRFMFFKEIAEEVSPVIDRLFPEESGVRVIGEPGRYFVAACASLCCSVVSTRSNEVDNSFEPEPIDDKETAMELANMSREEEDQLVRKRGMSFGDAADGDNILNTIQEELQEYSKLFASQQLAQQEVDVYTDQLDLYREGYQSATEMLGPPDESQIQRAYHTAEGCSYPLVCDDDDDPSGLLTLAAAGEAVVNGVVMQAVADSAPLQDDYAYYINDGVYGAFNNIMFDHASVRPRVLAESGKVLSHEDEDGMMTLDANSDDSSGGSNLDREELFASTVFGPTCDSIDVIARSVLLPKLKVGDWLYFNNMGAYTMAAASSFNGFVPSDRFYVCSIQPDYFHGIIEGPDGGDAADAAIAADDVEDEKKTE